MQILGKLNLEGANGQLPNLDYVNSVMHIIRWAGHCPPKLHDIPDEHRPDRYKGVYHLLLDRPEVKEYEKRARHITKQLSYGATGSPSGPEGVFGKRVSEP
jgi:glycosylphosphatidylinositol transamidase